MTVEVAVGLMLAHWAGDYVLQSDWMAVEKTSRWWPAVAHGLAYSACFVPLVLLGGVSWAALAVIGGTHVVIDRYRLARHLVWAKERLAPRRYWRTWAESRATGYGPEKPPWMAVWLMISADNFCHVAINYAAAAWL